jgi:molybdopterin/thiamine biosynthesis adenylyltransferase
VSTERAYSRPFAAIEALGDQVLDRHRFENKRVLLTGDAEVLLTPNGQVCVTAAMLMLVRVSRLGMVQFPVGAEAMAESCRTRLSEIGCGGWEVLDCDSSADGRQFDATLSVGWRGGSPTSGPSRTVINSNGWVARVSTGPEDLPLDCSGANPIGALAAACLGTSDVFKALLALKPTRGQPLRSTVFNLFDYTASETDPGPALPARLQIAAALCGAGAIGNGVAFLLSVLPVAGSLWIIDRQVFEEENLGTCLMLRRADIGRPKAEVLAEAVGTTANGLQLFPVHGEVVELDRRVEAGEGPRPGVVLGAFDNVDARHDAQDLWPDLVIDGAIGDFPCQVSVHPADGNVACARCLFRRPTAGSAVLRATRVTGLTEARVLDPDSVVTEADVPAADGLKQEWLRARLGRTVCSVVQEAVAQDLAGARFNPGFEPSVPFVACMSASMVVAELVKHAMGIASPLAPRFQMDMLRGPVHAEMLPQERRADCVCVLRRGNIDRLRRSRTTHS